MDYRLIDTHCHPQFPQYDEDRRDVITRALNEGVGMICVGTDLASSEAAMKLAQGYDGMYATVGVHPNDVGALADERDVHKELRTLLQSGIGSEKTVAIGETGLDYYRTTEQRQQEGQRERFLQHLELSLETNLPVIIHCRDAHADMRDILHSPEYKGKVRGVIHSFTGTWEDARSYIDIGFYIGLNGIITFAREYDETVKNAPMASILLETDAPYLTPVPYRGKRNEPLYVTYIADMLANIRDEHPEEVYRAAKENTILMFGIEHEGKV